MATWPLTIPQYVLQDGYQESLPDLTVRTGMEQGPAKVRRRSTAAVKKFSVTLPTMTLSQLNDFIDFYENDIAFGSLSFDWVHPRTQDPAVCRIIGGSVNVSPRSAYYLVSFGLEILP